MGVAGCDIAILRYRVSAISVIRYLRSDIRFICAQVGDLDRRSACPPACARAREPRALDGGAGLSSFLGQTVAFAVSPYPPVTHMSPACLHGMRGCGQGSQGRGWGKPLSGFAVGICLRTETITRTCRALKQSLNTILNALPTLHKYSEVGMVVKLRLRNKTPS